MRSSLQFSTSLPFALLLIGPPLAGKTNVAFQFPRPYFLDADDKLANAVQRFPGKAFFWDCPLRKPHPNDPEKEIPVEAEQRWTYATDCLKLAMQSPDIDTIVIDSATTMCDYLKSHILRFPSTSKTPLEVGGIKVMDQSMWGPFQDLWKRLILACRASGKLLVTICHEDYDKDEATGTFLYRPLIPGALKGMFASLFTDVWRCETKQIPDPTKPGAMKSVYYVRTQPTPRMSLGNSLGLPAEFEFSIEQFTQALNKARGVTP